MERRTRLAPMPTGLTYDDMKSSIGATLDERGHVSRPAPPCPRELEAWRRAARAAARTRGRTVRTVVLEDTLHAWLTDWPRDDRERALGVVPEVETLLEQVETAKAG
jgi:hypothetical protein